jgi:hypothetical protein
VDAFLEDDHASWLISQTWMINFRYHVVSLVAVFLALGIGVMFGSSFIAPDLVKRQTDAIQRLHGAVDQALQDSEQDHARFQQADSALASVVPRLVAGKLAGKKIAVVQTGDYSDATQETEAAITRAGGVVTSVTVITSKMHELSDKEEGRAEQDVVNIAAVDPSASSEAVLIRPVAASLRVGEDMHPILAQQLAAVEADGLVSQSGDYSEPVDGVVVVDGESDDSPLIHDWRHELVAMLQSSSIPGPLPAVVGCESEDCTTSSIPGFRLDSVASVDCIDRPIGALDLPFALLGGTVSYGVKKTADKMVPDSLSLSGDVSTGATAP